MIVHILKIIYGWKIFISIAVIICVAAAALNAARSPEIYQSSALVRVDIGQTDVTSGTTIAGRFAEAYLATQTQIVRDVAVSARAVELAGIGNNPQSYAAYQEAVPDQSIEFRRWLANQISQGIRVGLSADSSTLEIGYLATSPSDAKAMATLIRQAYLEEALSSQQFTLQKEAEWFEAQATNIRQRLQIAQEAKTAFERDNNIFVSRDGVSLDELQSQARAMALPPPIASSTEALPLAPSVAPLAELTARIAAAQTSLGPNHPAMVTMREQQAALQQAVNTESAAIAAGRAQTTVSPIPSANTAPAPSLKSDQIAEARRLAEDSRILEAQYNEYRAKATDLKMRSSSISTGLTEVGEASMPLKPIAPNWPLALALSFVFGLLVSSLSALLVEFLNLRVWDEVGLDTPDAPLINKKTARMPA